MNAPYRTPASPGPHQLKARDDPLNCFNIALPHNRDEWGSFNDQVWIMAVWDPAWCHCQWPLPCSSPALGAP